MSRKRLKFRILTDDVKIVEIDGKLSAVVGTADHKEMKGLVLTLLASHGFNKQMIKTFAYVLVKTYPWLWNYLVDVRDRLDIQEADDDQ